MSLDSVQTRVRRFLCGLSGHDSLRHFERGRISLKCVMCGYETPGWEVGPARTCRERPAGKQSVVSVGLVGERRAA
jgi:hypothetical protein